ncbi:MAG: hypothetical protein K2G38_02530 [Clostridia bacterium]|nr:hypothetical protein [Clostridia bacterium]
MKKKDEEKLNEVKPEYHGKTYAYIAIGLIVAAAVFLGLIFTKLGIYSLIASALFSIAALAFENTQRKKNNLTWLKFVKIAAYIVFALTLAVLVGGIIYSLNK